MSDCYANLAAIEEACKNKNANDLKRDLYLAPASWVDTIPEPTTGMTVDQAITMKDNGGTPYGFIKFVIGKTNQEYSGESAGDADSSTIEHRLQFLIPKITAGKTAIMNDLINGDFIILMQDRNGNILIIGELEDPAITKVSPQINTNGYLVSVEWDANRLAYHYTGAIPV